MTREEAIRKLQKQKAEYLEEWVDFSGVAEAYDMAIKALEQPIIRCKDCKHRYLNGLTWDCPFGLSGGEDFFCAYGSKMEVKQ